MKELKLLPENYTGFVKPRVADIQVINGGVTILYISDPIFIEGATYYRMKGNDLFEVKPEPRPIDSIKLSECTNEHVIMMTLPCGSKGRAITGFHEWNVHNFENGQYFELESLLEMKFTDIKIYEMT
jgi:hypothetical protein